ncbi:MAG TPA: glycosyltransferase family 4 protein [Sphingobacteriaceae bacterium]
MKDRIKKKIIRVATVPISLNILLRGQLSFLSHHYEVLAVSGSGQDLTDVQEREKIRVCPLKMERGISPLKDIISVVKLYRLFKKEKPLIVHSITPKAGLLSMLAGKAACVPIRMHTFTGLIFPSRKGILQNVLIWMDRLLCYCATNVYPEGEGVKADLLKYKITSKPLKVLANGNVNGVDLSVFDPMAYSANDNATLKSVLNIENSFVFIFVGRITKDKGINELIAAFRSVSEFRKNVRLILVGELERSSKPSPKTILEIENNENIRYMGFKEDIRPLLAVSDCLILPSYREGFPNVVLQAGAMGLPSIVTDINGCNEIIIEGVNGTIIDKRDVVSLHNSMLKMIDDDEFHHRLKLNARTMINTRYNQRIVWDALLKEYRSLDYNV